MGRQPNSRMCFICGRQNSVGLKLDFYQDEETGQVLVDFVVPNQFQGYPGVVHGGIVSAVLDEVSGRAVMVQEGDERLMATLRLTVRFRHPTPTDAPLTACGWVEQMSGVGAKVAGEIRGPDGLVTASCQALLTEPPETFRERWEQEMLYWRVYE